MYGIDILSSDIDQIHTPPLAVIMSIHVSYIIIKLYRVSNIISSYTVDQINEVQKPL
jgi:hypothetical protein